MDAAQYFEINSFSNVCLYNNAFKNQVGDLLF